MHPLELLILRLELPVNQISICVVCLAVRWAAKTPLLLLVETLSVRLPTRGSEVRFSCRTAAPQLVGGSAPSANTPALLILANVGVDGLDHPVERLNNHPLYTSGLVSLFCQIKFHTVRGTRAQWLILPPVRPWPCSPAAVLECCQFLDAIIRTRLQQTRIPSNRNQAVATPQEFAPLPLRL